MTTSRNCNICGVTFALKVKGQKAKRCGSNACKWIAIAQRDALAGRRAA